MTLKEILDDVTFTDEGRQACSLFRQHVMSLQRGWKRTTAKDDLEEIGRRAIIYNELIESLELLMDSKPVIKAPKRKRLHNKNR